MKIIMETLRDVNHLFGGLCEVFTKWIIILTMSLFDDIKQLIQKREYKTLLFYVKLPYIVFTYLLFMIFVFFVFVVSFIYSTIGYIVIIIKIYKL